VGEECRADWARFKQLYVDLARSYRSDAKRID
jgi:hypothetical protein